MMPSFAIAQLRRARQRASKRKLDANLYIDDWLQTCQDFDFFCAYCGVNTYSTIDHFVCLNAEKKGTTIDNCLPSCSSCNQRKGAMDPKDFLCHSPERFWHLRAYLESRRHHRPYYFPWRVQSVKGESMSIINQVESTPHRLACGKEIHIYAPTDGQPAVLQIRQEPLSNDPQSQSFVVAAPLTPIECVLLAKTLLQSASTHIAAMQPLEREQPRW